MGCLRLWWLLLTWAVAASAVEYPQGTNPDRWPTEAREFFQTASSVLSAYFPDEFPAGKVAGQHYGMFHYFRYMHTLYRVKQHMTPAARVLALGEAAHIPVLMQAMFKPAWMQCTSTEWPGNRTFLNHDDSTEITVEIAKHNLEREPLPYRSESADFVVIFEVLEHLASDPFYAFLEMHRVLRKNGKLFLSTPNVASLTALCKAASGQSPYLFSRYISPKSGHGYIGHVREYAWQELASLLGMAGFDVEVRCFNAYRHDDQYWDHNDGKPQPKCATIHSTLAEKSLDKLGSSLFFIARKAETPKFRKPIQLYDQEIKFHGYPACKQMPILCDGSER